MSKHSLTYPFIFFVMIFKTTKSFAFDPVAMAMTAQSAQNIINQVDEATDVGFALSDLMTEVGVETNQEEEDLQKAVDRIYKINSEARDLKWTSEDLDRSLNEDLTNGRSIGRRIKAMKNAIQASKKIATIMGFRPKAAEKAVRIQQIKLDAMMLEELQSIRKAQYLAYLEDNEAKLKREVFIQEILEKEKPSSKVLSKQRTSSQITDNSNPNKSGSKL